MVVAGGRSRAARRRAEGSSVITTKQVSPATATADAHRTSVSSPLSSSTVSYTHLTLPTICSV
eukprot:3058768-Rhodomonas_salina.1